MIFHHTGRNIVDEYVHVGYLRLYQYAVNPDGIAQTYELVVNKDKPYSSSVQKAYYDFYLSQDVSDAIIQDLCREAYITAFGRVHYLTRREADTVVRILCMGSSPITSIEGFLIHHPEFNKVKKRFD